MRQAVPLQANRAPTTDKTESADARNYLRFAAINSSGKTHCLHQITFLLLLRHCFLAATDSRYTSFSLKNNPSKSERTLTIQKISPAFLRGSPRGQRCATAGTSKGLHLGQNRNPRCPKLSPFCRHIFKRQNSERSPRHQSDLCCGTALRGAPAGNSRPNPR